MTNSDWLSPKKLREHYIDRAVTDMHEAGRQLYLAVITGGVRARRKAEFDPKWLKQIRKFKSDHNNRFALPSDIVVSIEDTRRKWLPEEAA